MSKKIMKRSLALGALMAFVITGSAMSVAEASRYVEGAGQTLDVVTQESGKDRIVGGWSTTTDKFAETFTGDITVNAGNWNMVIGGNYVSSIKNADTVVNVVDTYVTINGGKVKQVIGGSAGTDNKNLVHTWTGSSNLTITGGEFGDATGGNAPELLVVGGDLIKDNGSSAPIATGTSTISEVNTTISGGTFDSAIIGGSAAIQYYGGSATTITTNVGTATTNISGGEFKHAIAAGGLAYGYNSTANVENAVLNITGGTFNCDIFAGGLAGSLGAGIGVVESNTVENAKVNIENVEVKNIYGTGGVINWDSNKWNYSQNADADVNTALTLTNVKAGTVDIPVGSVTITASEEGKTAINNLKAGSDVKVAMVADGDITDKYEGKAAEMYSNYFDVNGTYTADGVMEEGDIVGETTFKVVDGKVVADSVKEEVHQGNASVAHMANIALMSWRAETNDMNKRMGELRNAKGEYGVWARMVGGEDEFKNATYEYTQYQLGYDEKLSVDPSWTVGVALSYTDGESKFGQGSGENTHKGLSVYGSKLNDDGSFIDLIAKYSRLEHDLTIDGDKGDYSTNGYSVSAEYGKRFEQGNGMWIEPQVELTYGKVKSAEYKLGAKTVNQDAMESLIGRIGFSLGKDIKDGNVYARASYLYDFEGETNVAFANGASRNFEYDLGGGWFEVGVGANINLSKATYIYADVEKTFGGEVDTNWQWNLGVRYSF